MTGQILKLEASAGSGKTQRLTAEYLLRLLERFRSGKGAISEREPYRLLGSVLAVTFTNKAAQEMKERILRVLKAMSGCQSGKDPAAAALAGEVAAALNLDRREAANLASTLLEVILCHYEDFQVKTIDSLMSAVIRVLAVELALAADFETAIDARRELEFRSRAFLAESAEKEWPRMEELLEDWSAAEGVSSWMPDERAADWLRQLFQFSLRQAGEIPLPDVPNERRRLAALAATVRSRLAELLEALAPGPSSPLSGRYKGFAEKIGRALAAPPDVFDAGPIAGSRFFHNGNGKERLRKGCSEVVAQRFLMAFASARRALADYLYVWSRFRLIHVPLFLPAFEEFWGRDRRTVYVEEFSRTLARKLHEWRDFALPYLYLKLSDRYAHFLFDEFQDTSELQFQALAPILDEVLSSNRLASLFVVGDRKQAIYRWRGGNPELMDEEVLVAAAPAIGLRASGGFSGTLTRNFRSAAAVVEFNNRFWDPATISSLAGDDQKLAGAVGRNFAAAVQEADRKSGGYVEVRFLPSVADNDECSEDDRLHDQVREIVLRLLDIGFHHDDIAVLLRENRQIRELLVFLQRQGIPCVSTQTQFLAVNPRVSEIVAFLKFIDYPPDDLSFYTFLRGEIFNARAAKLHPQEHAALGEAFFQAAPRRPFLYIQFRRRFPNCWHDLIEPFFRAAGFLPPYDLLADLTQAYQIYENFPSATPFVQGLADLMHSLEGRSFTSIAAFIEEWEALAESEGQPAVEIPEGTAGVRLLTMHQSKGLGFPAVIVPLRSRDRGRGRGRSFYYQDGGLFAFSAHHALIDGRLGEMAETEKIRATIDRLNLLYVAFTRAREALFVPVCPPETKGAGEPLSHLAEIVRHHPLLAETAAEAAGKGVFSQGALERRGEARPQASGVAAVVSSKRLLTRDWQRDLLVFRPAAAAAVSAASSRQRGERLHRVLARIGAVGERQELARQVLAAADAEGLEGDAGSRLADFLISAPVFPILIGSQQIYSEKEVAARVQEEWQFLRIDRLQVHENEIRVIDFKTGVLAAATHEAQLRAYLLALQPLFPAKKVRGFLLYVDAGSMREVGC